MNLFEVNYSVPTITRWSFGFFGVLAIVSMNFNLKLNSIGFYQLSKLCNIPCMVFYKYFFQHQTTPLNTCGSLVILLIGLCIFTVNDVQFNLIGSIIAAVAVISTSIYQTQTASLQKKYNVNGTQLQFLAVFPQFVICIIAAFAIETHGDASIQNHSFERIELVLIFLTGLFAVAGNVVAFSLIGKAGPVTFQVVGHVKTMLIFISGLIMFPEQAESNEQFSKKVFGLFISMGGVILYTIFEIQNKKPQLTTQDPTETELILPKDEKDGINFENVDESA